MIEGAEARIVHSPGIDRPALERLQRALVGIAGAGVTGGQTSYHLGLLGVRQLIIDPDRVGPENLGNAGFPVSSLGQPKSEARAAQIKALNPDCEVRPIDGKIEDLGLGALAACDLLISGLDSRVARIGMDQISRRLGIPWIDCAVDGSGVRLLGTVTLYDPRCPDSACYVCRHDSTSLAQISREGRGPGCPSWRSPAAPQTAPTYQASAFASVTSGLQALWATRVLLGCADELVSKQLLIQCDHRPVLRLLELERNSRCLADHARLEPLHRAPGEAIGGLMEAARAVLGGEVETIVFYDRSVARGLECPACGARRDLVRLSRACSDDDVRCDCGEDSELLPVELSTQLSGPVARGLAHLRWEELGFPASDIVTAVAGDRSAHYLINPPPEAQETPQ